MTKRAEVRGSRITWLCQGCGQPIVRRSGYIEVDEMVAFRHREVWREFNKKQKAIAEAEGHGGLVSYSLGDMPDVPLGRWQAWHRQCDPHPDSNSYWIAVERCKTLGELVHWAGHLMQKNWMQDTDLSRLLLELGTWS